MNIELLITIAAAIVLANLINKIVVNPLLNKMFGSGSSKVEGGRSEGFKGAACASNFPKAK